MSWEKIQDCKPCDRIRGARMIWVAICAALLIVCSRQTLAQAGIDMGSITGTVKDPVGALVPGAHCTLTDEATSVTQEAITTSAGAYTFPLVKVGTYTLKVDARGFEAFQVKGIIVHLGSTVTQDVTLKVGAASASVTVTSAAPLLQAQDASLGTTITSDEANDMPIFGGDSGRSFMSLTTLAAGVQFENSATTTSTFLVHGITSQQVDVRLNGADDNAEVFGGIAISPIPESIQEVKLQTGNNSAELGHSYGAVVNVVTKRGSNRFKGEAWEYNENDMYNANDYFNKLHQLVTGNPKMPNRPGRFKENSFGFLFGGPIILPHFYNGHNKTFFMGDYQRTYYTNSSTFNGTVPSDLMQSSNFTDLSDTLRLSTASNAQTAEKEDALGRWFQNGLMLDPATTRAIPCGSSDPITGLPTNCKVGYVVTNPNNIGGSGSTEQYAIVRDPFLSGAGGCPTLQGTTTFNSSYNHGTASPECFNQLPANRLDPNAITLLKMFPAANQTTKQFSGDYFTIRPQPTLTQQFDIRIDHTISDSDSLFGTYSQVNQVASPTPPFPGIIEGGSNVNFWTNNRTYMIVLTETHVFNPNLINEFRASDAQVHNTRCDPGDICTSYGLPQQFGVQGIPQVANNGGLPTFTVNSGISSFGSRTNPTWSKDGALQFSDNLTKTTGKHELKFGGELSLLYGDIVQPAYERGSFTYSGEFSNVPNSGTTQTGLADFLLLPGSNVANSTYAAAGGLSTTNNTIGGVSGYSGNDWAKSTYHAPYLAFYAVDTWKITPRFTANLGLREEHYPPYSSDGGKEANFWMGGNDANQPEGAAYYVGSDSCSAPMSSFFVGLLAYDNIPIICQSNNTANKANMFNWAPRVGLAYRVQPNIVARVGGGIAYGAFGNMGYGSTLGTNYPFVFTVAGGSADNAYTPERLADGVTAATMENTFGSFDITNPLDAALPLGSIPLYGKQYHYRVPSVTTLTAAVQWQFTNHDSIEARYVGNLGRHLDTLDAYHNSPRELLTPNTSVVTLNPTSGNLYAASSPDNTVPFPNLSLNSSMDTTNMVSNYQSGELEYQHQMAGGFYLDANYTYTRCWSDAVSGGGAWQNTGGPDLGRAPLVAGFGGYRADYVRCSHLATHTYRASGGWNLPVGKGARWAAHINGWEDAIIGGWKLNPVLFGATGILQNISCQGTNGYGDNPTFTGPWFQTTGTNWSCHATLVPGQHLYGPGPNDKPRTKINGYWNSSAFTAPQYAVQQNGLMDFSPLGGRGNQIYGPSWYNLNAALHKSFRTSEGTRLEFQAQAMNVLNHMEPGNPQTSNYTEPNNEALTGGWGTVTATKQNNGEGRFWQFVGKFYF